MPATSLHFSTSTTGNSNSVTSSGILQCALRRESFDCRRPFVGTSMTPMFTSPGRAIATVSPVGIAPDFVVRWPIMSAAHDNCRAGDRFSGLFDTNQATHFDKHFQRNLDPRRVTRHDLRLIVLERRGAPVVARRQFAARASPHRRRSPALRIAHRPRHAILPGPRAQSFSRKVLLPLGRSRPLVGGNRDGHSAKQLGLCGDNVSFDPSHWGQLERAVARPPFCAN